MFVSMVYSYVIPPTNVKRTEEGKNRSTISREAKTSVKTKF